MLRFVYALLVATSLAQDADTAETETDAGEASSAEVTTTGNWFISDQQPIEFTSIETADPYNLTGKYGWYQRAGVEFVFISQTVGGATLVDDGFVLTWAQFPDPSEPGNIEGFYCTVKYNSAVETGKNVDVETFEGSGVDFETLTGGPDDWCPPPVEGSGEAESTVCKRHSVAQWQEFFTFENYPTTWDESTQVSTQACSAWRKTNSPDAFIEIKTGTPYTVSTGYKTYESASTYALGTVDKEATGADITMTFESAAALVGTAVAVASILAF